MVMSQTTMCCTKNRRSRPSAVQRRAHMSNWLKLISLLLEVASAKRGGTWTETSPMTVVRQFQTATLLRDGNVLVAAGYGDGGRLASAELYDPARHAWTATGSLNAGRGFHTATLLLD